MIKKTYDEIVFGGILEKHCETSAEKKMQMCIPP